MLEKLREKTSVIDFDEEKHEYSIGGQKLPGVTTILKRCGIIDTKWFTEGGMENGKRRHYLTELYDKGTLDWSTISEEDMPYLQAWILYLKDFRPKVVAMEEVLYHKDLLYCGTADRLTDENGEYVFIDLKSGAPLVWHNLQLILYGLAFESLVGIRPKLRCVYLKKNGKYAYKDYDYKDELVALSAVRIDRWKTLNGKK